MPETPPAIQDPRVDYSRGVRPAVRGGECSGCLHRPPLHEEGCTALPCVAPAACGCAGCGRAHHLGNGSLDEESAHMQGRLSTRIAAVSGLDIQLKEPR